LSRSQLANNPSADKVATRLRGFGCGMKPLHVVSALSLVYPKRRTLVDTMLETVKTVRSALNDFYASLSDEQKAPRRSVQVA
jgi:hypothetical protein